MDFACRFLGCRTGDKGRDMKRSIVPDAVQSDQDERSERVVLAALANGMTIDDVHIIYIYIYVMCIYIYINNI